MRTASSIIPQKIRSAANAGTSRTRSTVMPSAASQRNSVFISAGPVVASMVGTSHSLFVRCGKNGCITAQRAAPGRCENSCVDGNPLVADTISASGSRMCTWR
jgi:hypothetical protein